MRALTIAAVLLLAGAPNAVAGGANGLLVSNTDFNCYLDRHRQPVRRADDLRDRGVGLDG